MDKKILFNQLKKFNGDFITQIDEYIPLSENAKFIFEQHKEPVTILQTLLSEQLYTESVSFLALGLPAKEVVWWAYLAALKAEGEEPSEKVLTALTSVRHWVHKTNDELRYQAKSSADELDECSASRWAALAAFWSGENIAPKNKPMLNPNPKMSSIASANAVLIAAEQGEERDLNFLTLILQGIHIANAGNGQLNQEQQASLLHYLEEA